MKALVLAGGFPQILVLFVFSFGAALILWNRKTFPALLVWLAGCGVWIGGCLLLREKGIVVHVLWGPAAVTLIFAAAILANYTRAYLARQKITRTFGRYVDPAVIRELMDTLGVPLSRDIAICLYTGISTDTGNFAFGSTNAETFRVMSELMEHDLPLAKLNRILFRVKSREQMKLLGKALESMTFRGNGKIAVMKLTIADFEACGALSEHADTIVNYGLDTTGTAMALLGRETHDGHVKFSLRTKEPLTVNDIAAQFGGGGHPQASGITMDGTLDECVEQVLSAMEEKI